MRNRLASTFTTGASLLDGEETLLHSNLADAVAGLARDCLGTRRSARPTTRFALGKRRELDRRLVAEHRLFEIELQVIAQIGTSIDLPAAAASCASEDVTEDITEDVAEGVARTEASAAASPGQAFMTVLIVNRTALRIG